MRIPLLLLLTFILFSIHPGKAFAQACQTPAVSLPGDKYYCGTQNISFTTNSVNHKTTYSGTTTTYKWTINDVVSSTDPYPIFSLSGGKTYVISVTVYSSCGEATATQTIQVDARPAAPVVENGGMCTGMQGTLWVNEPDPNLIYKWYNVATGGTPLVWGTSYTSGTSGDYYVEAVTQQGCTSSTRTKASLTASSPTGSGGGLSVSTQEVCSGVSPGQITGNAPNSSFMTYQWFQSTTGSGTDFYPIPTARNKDYTPPALYQTTWFKRVAYNGFCGEESNVLKITVTPLPASPIADNAVICAGTNATLTVSNASTSSIYRWYDVASGGTAIAVGPVFTTPALTTSRTYYVEASTTNNTNCSSVTQRTAVSVTVTPGISNNTVTGDQNLCSGGTAVSLIGGDPTGGGGGYTYQWQRSTDGSSFTDIAGANAKDYNPGALTTTTWYRRKVRAASTCPETTSNTVRVTVSILPVSIDIVDPATCAGSGTTISISNPNSDYTYRWYDVASGGTALRTGTTFPTGPLTTNRTYYVEVTTAAGCISARRSVTVTVTPVPAKPAANGATICSGTGTTLSVNPANASLYYRWYDAPTGGTHVGTGENFPTGPLTSDKTFYVEAVTYAVPGCVSPREAVQVTVIPAVTNTITPTNQEICSGATPALVTGQIPTGGGGGYTYQWQYSEDGTLFTDIAGATGRDYAPAALTATTWYRRWVYTASGTCPAVVSNEVRVDVNKLPTVPAIPGQAVCTGTQAIIQIPSADANLKYNWYTVATGGVPVAADLSTFTTEVLTSNKTYYVEAVTEFGCVSASRSAVTVSVAPLPGVPTADNISVCAGSRPTLSVISPDANLEYQWFDAASAGTLLATGTSFTTPNILNASTTYYIQAVNATGCASSSRKAVTVTVVELPPIPEVAGATICSGGATTLYVNNSNPEHEYRWYSGSTLIATGTSFNTGNLSASATYYVDAVTKGGTACTSTGRRSVTVTVTPPIANNTISAPQSICSGNTPAALTGTTPTGGSTPLTFQWEKSENGVNFTSIAGATNSTYTPGILSTTTWFRRIVRGSDTCPQNVSNVVQITVTPLPATPIADNQTICSGTSAVLSVNSPVAGITYKWYNTATGGNILSTAATYTTDILDANTTFYVEATNANGCISQRRPVAVIIRELPEMPTAANKTICYGQNTTLSVSSPDPTLTYKWYNADGQLLSSLPNLNVTGLQASAVYYLEATYVSEPDCSSPRREVTVTVTPLPVLPVADNIIVCSGTKGMLQVQNADPTLTYKWYNTEADGTSIATGTTFETHTLTSARTYYVEASTASGCLSGRKQVTVNVSALPETPFANNVEICASATALLSITDANDALTYQWYATNTATTPLATGRTFQTGALQANSTFYVEAVTAAGCVSPTRKAVAVNVIPLPATPNANDALICAGSDATLAVENPVPSLLYKWYNSDGVHLATGILYNTGVLTESKTYYLEAVTDNITACASPSRKTVTVTVTPAIANNTISGNQTLCTGSTPATLTGSLPTGGGTAYSYQWQQSTDGINFTNITGATSQNYTPGAVSTSTWYRRRVTASGPCGANFSAPVQITIVAQPATPLASNSTICSGTKATLTISDADNALSYRWYNTATGGNILNIDDTFETPELSTTTTFYVEAVNTNGCSSPRRAITVFVTPVPETPLVADAYICEGQAATLTVSPSVQNLVYSWYDNTGARVGTGTTYTTPGPLSASTTYYVEASTTTNPACTSERRAVAVVVMSQPAIPVVENATICSGTSAILSVRVIDPAITYKWYTALSGGTPVAESINFTTPALTSNRTYYVEAVNAAGCTSARASVAVTVTPLPTTPVAEHVSICAGATALLTVANADDNLVYKWYDAATDGNLLATGTNFTTASLQNSVTYYLAAETVNGCISTTRRAVTVNVTPLPASPEVNNATICAGSNTTLWITNQTSGIIYKWYDNTGTYLATGTSYTTTSLNASTTYLVEAVTNSGTACASSPRKVVNVTVIDPIANNTVNADQAVCTGGIPAPITGTVPTGGNGSYTYQWERSTDGINFSAISGAVTQNYTPATAITTDTWFRRKVSVAGGPCSEHISNAVKMTAEALPATPVANGITICAGTAATLQVGNAGNGLTYRWYTSAIGGSPIHAQATYVTNELSESTTYFVEAMSATGCVSPRRAVTVTVRPLPEVPVVADKAICHNQTTTLAVTSPAAGVNYKWFDRNNVLVATGVSYTTPALDKTTIYYIEASYVSDPECTSITRATATVSVTSLPSAPVASGASICSGGTANLAVSVVDANLTYKWYTVASGGTSVATSANFTTPVLTSGRTYYVEAVTQSGCASPRTMVAVDVTQQPAAPLADNLEVCAGSTALLAVNNPDVNLTYNWYDEATDGELLATGETYTIASITSSRTIYVEAVTATGCVSPTRKAVEVIVTPLPLTPQVNNATVCAGQSAVLSVAAAEAGVIYKWYNAGAELIYTGTTFTSTALQASTIFYVEGVTNNSTACASSPRRTVYVTVTPAIANNAISTDQTICSGSIAALLNGSAPTGGEGSYTYQWERSTDGINFNTIQGATEKNYAPGTLTSDTWFRRRVSATGTCQPNVSNIIRITVTPQPATPAAQGVTICEDGQATLSVSNPNNTLTYFWYSVATGGNSIGTGQTFPVYDLAATATYYVEARNSNGCTSPRRAVTITVVTRPDAPVAANKNVCYNEGTILAVTSPNQSLVYKWYNDSNTLLGTGTTYNTGALTANTTYYVEASTTGNTTCVSDRSVVVVSVTTLPATPVVENVAVCAGSSAQLTVEVIDPTVTYNWYTAAIGGSPVATGPSYTTGTLTSGRSYFVEAVTSAGCASPRAQVAITVDPLPATPIATNVNICAGSTATLTVSNPDGNLSYRWYDAATDGTLLATGETYTTGRLSASDTYFVEAVTAIGCTSVSRRAVTVNVTPLPATPEVNNATICAGQTVTLWVNNPDPTLYYNWYNAGALVATGVSYTTENLSASATYYVEAVTNTGTECASASRRTVTVTVTPAITNNFIGNDQAICSGSTPAMLTGSLPNGGGGNYSYQWERSEDGINFTSIANATSQHYTPNALNITTWYRRRVKAIGPCAEHMSNIIQINTTAIPTTPVADNATICEGSTATLRIKDANAGYTYRWYTTPVGGSAIMAATSFTTSTLESTTNFYVEAVNATGCVSPRRTVTVTVMQQPDAPLAADQNVCAGEQATLVVSNQASNLTYSWYDGNGTLLGTGTTFTTGALNNNTIYYVEASTTTVPSCVSGRTAVTVYVTARPATPIANNVSVCAGSPAELSVSGVIPGLTYKWYTVATGGQPIHTNSTYTTQPLTSNRTYYLEAVTANGCVSSERRAVTVTVTQQPAQPAVADRTVCYGERASLTVSSPNSNLMYRWYDRDGVQLATGTTYTTNALTANALYYVEAVTQTSPNCISQREAVNVTVTNIPAAPVVDNTTICTGSSTTLFVKNATPGAVYKWYDENETIVATGTTFTTEILSNDAIYTVEVSSAAGCVNTERTMVTVTVTQQLTNNTITANQTICSGAVPARITGSQPGNTNGTVLFQWEYSEDGTNYTSITNATGRDYQPNALNVTTWYRRKATVENGVCAEQYSNMVKVTTVALPLAPVASNVTICAGAQATLRVDAAEASYTYRWFEVATGGSSLANGTFYTISGLTSDKTYYVEAVNSNGCISPRKAVTVYTTPLPAMPQAADKVICAGGSTTLSVTNPDTKLNYRWFDSNGALVANGSSYTTPALGSNTVYFVEAFTNTALACTSPRRAVNVAVTPLPSLPEADDAFVCAGGTATLSVKQPDPALSYRWYTAATGGTPLAAQPTFETGALTSDRTYFVEAVNASGCVSPREAVNVFVTPLPAEPLASNKAICAGETVILSVNQPDVTLTYRWFDNAGKLLATGNTYSVSGLAASATYYVEAMTAAGCVSPTRKGVVVSVSQLPGVPTVENASICAGERVTLFVKNPDPTLEYRWYNDAAGTNIIGSGISYTSTDALFAGKSYFVEAVNTAGCVSSTRKQVDVRVIGKPATPVVNDATICAGSSATLSVTAPDGAMVYKWYDVNGTFLHTGITYTTVPLSSKAIFHVVASTTTTPACASDVQVVTVNIATPLTNNTISGSQTICSGATPARLSGSLPGGGSTATIAYQWESSTDGVNFVSIVGAYAQDYAPGQLTADTWFRRVARSAGPCSQTVSNAVMVTVVPLPASPVAENQRVCTGGSATLRILNPSSTADNIAYRWYNVASGGSALASGISFVTPALSANTTYYVEATNGNGCISSTRRAVQVLVDQQITNNTISGNQSVCTGSKATALFGSQPDGGSGAYTYQWQRSADGANFTDISGATGQGYTPTEEFTKTTWFRRKVKAEGPCSESISGAVKIEVGFSPNTPTVTSAAICPGVSTTLTASAMAGLTVEWYDAPQGGTLVFVGDAYTTPILNSTTSYWVQSVSSSGCVSKRQEARIDVVGPQVTISDDLTIIEGKTVQLSATGGASYEWSPAEELSDPTISTPVAKPSKTTTYVVKVTTREGCVVTKQVTVTVLPKITITNVITPNADGYNDKFDIKGIENYPNATIEIYTRWGEQVFQSKGYPEAWNGTKNGNALPVGAYYYIIKLDATSAPISGSVTIVK